MDPSYQQVPAGVPLASAEVLRARSIERSEFETSDEEEETTEVEETPRDGSCAFMEIGPEEPDPMDVLYLKKPDEELIETMGVSGMSVMSETKEELWSLVLIAAQAFFIQYIVLYNMALQFKPTEEGTVKAMPRYLLIIAIYLHFFGTLGDVPFGMVVGRHFFRLQKSACARCITLPIFLVDAVCTPLATLIIGSLFLCTSACVADVLLNSCAVAFISGIDNVILMLNGKMKQLESHTIGKTVCLPYSPTVLNVLRNAVVIFPVVPAAFAILMTHVGLDIMKL